MAGYVRFKAECVEEDIMALLDEAMTACMLLNRTYVPDGYGGRIEQWSDSGVKFNAAIVLDSSMQAKIGQQMGVTSVYTVTTRKPMILQFHDAFRRLSDAKIFRVTSKGDDKKTPDSATLNMRQVSAEEWSLPNG